MTLPVARLAGTLPPAGTRLAVAVSGGADSLALLLLAAAARPGEVVAATVDHRLRAAAAAEAALVGRVAADLGVPHAILGVTVAAAGQGIQAAARTARYAALADWAAGMAATHLLTAHHADDQAETLLMRLARGAGLAGLAGVRPSRRLANGVILHRPLLDWRRSELAAVVAAAGVQPVDDPSNRDPAHDRTAFRALLAAAPRLDARRLAHSAAHLQAAEAALDWTAANEWHARATPDAAGWRLDLAGLPFELRRRLLARALPGARGGSVAALLRRLERVPATTLMGWLVRADGDVLRILPAPPRQDMVVPPTPASG